MILTTPLGLTTLVVPCFNEASRLDDDAFLTLTDSQEYRMNLLFVDDGSSDRTRDRLQGLCALRPERISMLALDRNRGKAEAVRRGLLEAVSGASDAVGYVDADLSTPVGEIQRLLGVFKASRMEVLIGARVALLGRDVRRNTHRHYLGRIFASAASWALQLRVYDTQCGAKLFLSTPLLKSAIEQPFISRWAFDVELLGRLLTGSRTHTAMPSSQIMEEPLRIWVDKPGSKLGSWQMARTAFELLRIARRLRRDRRR